MTEANARIPDRFRAFIDANLLLEGVRRLGLAVSGGSDSMALMRLAQQECRDRGIAPVVLCLDHAIPGENSAAEARFVQETARGLGLECLVEKADPPVAPSAGESLEMAARRVRRAFFRRMAVALRLDAVATGHQRDDVAETLLMRLMRGAGAAGLGGLRPRSPAVLGEGGAPVVVRPLLGFGREELRDYLRSRGATWMDDVSNADESIVRCRMRHSAVPALARAAGTSPEVLAAALAQSADLLRADDAWLDGLAAAWLDSHGGNGAPLAIGALCGEPLALARRVARLWLQANAGAEAMGFAFVGALLETAAGAVNLPRGQVLDVAGGFARLRHDDVVEHGVATVPIGGEVRWGDFRISARRGEILAKARPALGAWPATATLSLAAVAGRPLVVRARRNGDRMRPFGLGGWKKVQDVFVDGKLPASLRDAYPLVFCGDELAWIPGYRIASGFAAKPGDGLVEIRVARFKP